MSLWIFALAQASVLAYGLVGGVFLAFSDFIMRSLAQSGGAEAMQTINREVFRWVFMALFLGLAPVSLVLAGHGLWSLDTASGRLLLAAGLTYLLGCFAVTVAGNVPMNEALARMAPAEPATAAYWRATYLPRWTGLNTVRTVACALAALLAMGALLWGDAQAA